MKFRKLNEWEDHSTVPGGDEMMLLEAVDVSTDRPQYARVSWSELTNEEFSTLEDGDVVELPHSGYSLRTPEQIGEQPEKGKTPEQ